MLADHARPPDPWPPPVVRSGRSPGWPALAVVAAAGLALAGLLLAVRTGEVGVDHWTLRWLLAHRSSTLTTLFRLVTRFGDARTVTIVLLAVGAFVAVRRRWRLLALVIAAPVATSLLTAALKGVVGRARPALATRAVAAAGYAFPSGHSSQAVASYGVVAIVAAATLTDRRLVKAVWAGAAALAVAVGISRAYLGVHWTTDVVGGWALGAACLGACWLVLLGHERRLWPAPVGADGP